MERENRDVEPPGGLQSGQCRETVRFFGASGLVLDISSRQYTGLLQLQQEALAPQTAAVTGQGPVLADHTVTGNQEAYVIHSVGAGHRTLSGGLANTSCQFIVRNRRAIRNPDKFPPDLVLEGRTLGSERHAEGFPFALEVFVQLCPQLIQQGMLAGNNSAIEAATQRL